MFLITRSLNKVSNKLEDGNKRKLYLFVHSCSQYLQGTCYVLGARKTTMSKPKSQLCPLGTDVVSN